MVDATGLERELKYFKMTLLELICCSFFSFLSFNIYVHTNDADVFDYQQLILLTLTASYQGKRMRDSRHPYLTSCVDETMVIHYIIYILT